MTADEDIRMITVYQFAGTGIITAWVAPDVSHQDLHVFTFEETVKRMDISKRVIVAVAGHTHKWLELSNLCGQFHAPAEVPRMPDFIHRGEEFAKWGVKNPVSI